MCRAARARQRLFELLCAMAYVILDEPVKRRYNALNIVRNKEREMGLFKNSHAEAAENAKNEMPSTPTRNVAVKVSSFNVEAGLTTGVDICTGEELSIKLRGLSKTFEKQGGVHLWSKTRGKSAVAAGEDGGVIVFESVVREKDGALTSRWGVVASHDAQEAEVLKVYARPAAAFKSRNDLDEKRAIEIAHVDQAKVLKNEDDVRESIASVISRPFTVAVVRAFDGDEIRVATVWKGRDDSPQQAVDNFLKINAYLGRHLTNKNMAQDEMIVEVFPMERIYSGADTREMLRDASKLDAQRFSRDWSLGDDRGWGFGESLVALRTHDEGGRFFTMMLPAVNRQPLWTLDSLPSANITPAAAPAMSTDSSARHEPAPNANAQPEDPVPTAPTAPTAEPVPAAPTAEPIPVNAPPQSPAPASDAPDIEKKPQPVMSEAVLSEVASKVASGVRLFRR